MPNNYFVDPLTFLIELLLGLYIGIVALRLIMQWAHWDHRNPLVQFIIRATQIPVKFFRQFIPPLGRWDSATIALLIILTVVKIVLLTGLQSIPINTVLMIRLGLADIFSLFVTLFTASIIIQVILSWITPSNRYNPATPLVSQMNTPLLRPIQRWLPSLGGLDLSPLVALIGLQLLSKLVLPLLIGHV